MRKIFTLFSAIMLSLGAFAELNYGVTLTQNDFDNASTVVEKAEGQTIVWDNGEARCGGTDRGAFSADAWNWDDKYFVVKLANGVPDQLTFQYIGYFATTQTNVSVKESVNGSDWTDLWNTTSNASSWTAVTQPLQPTTRYLRFCFHGNFSASFKDIKVTETIEMGTLSVESLNFGTVKVDDVPAALSFELGWTNLVASVVSSDAHFTVNPASFGEIGAFDQTATVSVGFLTNEAGTYSGTITVEGRGHSAQVAVSGVVEKHNQTITWEPASSYNFNQAIPLAMTTSGLNVTYEIANPSVLKFENGAFKPLYAGTTQVTAKQAGNYKYNAATPVVRTITIVAQPTSAEENKTIEVGAHETWNGYDLSTYPVGSYQLAYVTKNAQGGDHTITLNLTVTKQGTIHQQVALEFCEGDSVEFRGHWWNHSVTFQVSAEGEVADTIFDVTITMNESPFNEDSQTVVAGETIRFNEEGWLLRGEVPVTEYATTKKDSTLWFVRYSHTEKGCEQEDRIYIELDVLDPVELEQELEFCEGDSAEYRGVVYSEEGEFEVLAEGEIRDTLITVIVTINEKRYRELDPMTVAAGDPVVLPEGEWLLGEETVSGQFITSEENVPGLEFVQIGETEEGCEAVVRLMVTVTSREGVENVFIDAKAEKFFRNGELFIRRGEQIFTATGERVE